MIRKTISMPDEMGAFIEERVKSGKYGNESEYLRDLIRKEQERLEAIDVVQKMVDEALASGISPRTPQDILDDVLRRHEQRARAAE